MSKKEAGDPHYVDIDGKKYHRKAYCPQTGNHLPHVDPSDGDDTGGYDSSAVRGIYTPDTLERLTGEGTFFPKGEYRTRGQEELDYSGEIKNLPYLDLIGRDFVCDRDPTEADEKIRIPFCSSILPSCSRSLFSRYVRKYKKNRTPEDRVSHRKNKHQQRVTIRGAVVQVNIFFNQFLDVLDVEIVVFPRILR